MSRLSAGISLATDVDPAAAVDAFPDTVAFFANHKPLVENIMADYAKYYVLEYWARNCGAFGNAALVIS